MRSPRPALLLVLLLPLGCKPDGPGYPISPPPPTPPPAVAPTGDGPRFSSPYKRDAAPPSRKYPGPCIWFWDLDSDGLDEATSIAAYDAADRLVLVRTDWTKSGPTWTPADPIPGPGQPQEHFKYTFDEQGRLATEYWVSHGTDHPDETVTFEYDGDKRVRGRIDTSSDGRIDGAVTYEHDAKGRIVAEHLDVDGDGTIDQEVTHTFDAHGNRVRSWYGPTGEYDQEFVDYNFDCWSRGGPQRVEALPPPAPDYQRGERPPLPDDDAPDSEPSVGEREEYERTFFDDPPLLLPPVLADGPFELLWPDGSPRLQGLVEGGRPEGLWTAYYEGGGKQAQGRFAGGRAEGLWQWWYRSGQLKEQGGFAGGLADGRWTMNYRDGARFEELGWRGGRYDGPWRIFHRNGVVAEERLWQSGRQVGEQIDRDEAGAIVARGRYEAGEPTGAWSCRRDGALVEVAAPRRLMTPSDHCRAAR